MPKITDLAPAGALDGSEELPAHQDASTVKATVDDIAAYAGENLPVSGVTPGTYGDASNVAQITVGADGRITSATEVGISGGPGGADGSVCCGRLTLESGVPVSTTDQTAKTTIYWTPYKGAAMDLYDGSGWQRITGITEKSLALGTLAAAFQAYDVFGYLDSGTLALEALEWKSGAVTMTIATPCVVTWTGGGITNGMAISFTTSGALPTGLTADTQYFAKGVSGDTFNLATIPDGTSINTSGTQSGVHTAHCPRIRGTALALQDGVLVKSGSPTRRYLGTFFSTSTTETETSRGGASTQVGAKRFIWNAYNRVRQRMVVFDSSAQYTYATATWRMQNNAAGNCVEFVVGLAEDAVEFTVADSVANQTTGSHPALIGVGVDSTTTPFSKSALQSNGTATIGIATRYEGIPGIGYHRITCLQNGNGATTNSWFGILAGEQPISSGAVWG